MGMKRTLLELTQDILASMDGEEVTSISDTSESAQVANIIRQCFYQLASDWKLPEHEEMFQLTETSAGTPTLMTKPDDVMSIDWVKYNAQDVLLDDYLQYGDTTFVPWEEFLSYISQNDSDDENSGRYTLTLDSKDFTIPYKTDRAPRYWSSPDDYNIIFDSYDSEVDLYVRATKTAAYGLKEPTWTHSDSFVPPLDHKQHNLLFQEAKAQCFVELKGVENPRAEKKARRATVTLTKEKHDVNAKARGYYYDTWLPDYGRRR